MGVARRKLAVMGKPPVNGSGKKAAGKKATGRGASMLNEAADKTLEENSSEIAKSLLANTLKGNVSSIRMLMELAGGPAESGKAGTKRRFRSIAKELAAEPEWSDDAIEAAAETGARQLEA
jgi:hypothetical protein